MIIPDSAALRPGYAGLMPCAWQTVRSFSLTERDLQGTPGAIAVLHTHSRRLDDHPPVHRVMPAAALDAERRLWRVKHGPRDLFHHKALAKVFRAQRPWSIWVAIGTGASCRSKTFSPRMTAR